MRTVLVALIIALTIALGVLEVVASRASQTQYPDAHPLAIIGDYNSDPDFTKRWPPFSLSQMQTLVDSRKGKTR